jgi:hypothetical protein
MLFNVADQWCTRPIDEQTERAETVDTGRKVAGWLRVAVQFDGSQSIASAAPSHPGLKFLPKVEPRNEVFQDMAEMSVKQTGNGAHAADLHICIGDTILTNKVLKALDMSCFLLVQSLDATSRTVLSGHIDLQEPGVRWEPNSVVVTMNAASTASFLVELRICADNQCMQALVGMSVCIPHAFLKTGYILSG